MFATMGIKLGIQTLVFRDVQQELLPAEPPHAALLLFLLLSQEANTSFPLEDIQPISYLS